MQRIIVQKYLQRKLIGVCTELQEMAYDEATDVSDLMDKAQKAVFDIADGNIKKDTAEIAPIIDEAIKGIQAAAEKPDGISGLPSGFNALDAVTSGWQPSDLVIIAARPAMGKTAFCAFYGPEYGGETPPGCRYFLFGNVGRAVGESFDRPVRPN